MANSSPSPLSAACGWLFLLAGLALVTAAIVVPAEQELRGLQDRVEVLQEQHARLLDRLAVHQRFLDDLDGGDTDLLRRVADMQMNRTAEGTLVLRDPGAAGTPLEWLSRRSQIAVPIRLDESRASLLARWTAGRGRLWTAAVGSFCVFVGLIWGPIAPSRSSAATGPVPAAAR